MPAWNLLIKPASSACNLDCKYCFYRDVAASRETPFRGMMTEKTLELLVREAFRDACHFCGFNFQGGEPTVIGLPFYRRLIELQKQFNPSGIEVQNAIQTNGFCIDEEWAAFLGENGFLIGLSLDGPAKIHNQNRIDQNGKGSWNRVMKAARLLKKYRVPVNILSVVTGQSVRKAESIYRFLRGEGFSHLQFIPCLDPFGEEGAAEYSLTAEQYGEFLVQIFDLWWRDFLAGNFISVRHIDNWLAVLMGGEPEACAQRGHCQVQLVVEGDGSVYPCDFYCLDRWKLGQLGETGLCEMHNSLLAQEFLEPSARLPDRCRECPYFVLCRNGCRRERAEIGEGALVNIYCESYRYFFSRRLRELEEAAAICRRLRNFRKRGGI